MVSVIIPVYKVEKYIRECVDSVINQTYTDLEIILVDDGSPDNCGKICDEYAQKDFRIKVIHKENGGLSDARNAGMDVSNGEYIYFLDSDDYIKPDAMSQLVECIEKEDADFVYFDAETIVEDFEDSVYRENFIRSHVYNTGEGTFTLASHIRNLEYYSCVPLLFIRKKYLDINNIIFYKGIVHEDELFTPEVFFKAKRAAYLNQPLYVRRMRAGSIMSERKSEESIKGLFVCIQKYLIWMDNYRADSSENYCLKYFLCDKANTIMEIYCNLNNISTSVYDGFKDTSIVMKKLNYCGNKKLMIKYHIPSLYRFYVRNVRPVKDNIVRK